MFSLPWLLGISGVSATFLIPLGFGALSMTKVSPKAFQFARICFVASGVMPAVTVWYLATQFLMPLWAHFGVAVIGSTIVALPMGYLLRLVNENQNAHRETEVKTTAPITAQEPTGSRIRVSCGKSVEKSVVSANGEMWHRARRCSSRSPHRHELGCRCSTQDLWRRCRR